MGQTIVIAWLTEEQEHDGEPYARDMGERPGMRAVYVPHALVWLSGGTDEDAERARACVADDPPAWDAAQQRRVLIYPASEPDPLGRAKRDVLACPTCHGSTRVEVGQTRGSALSGGGGCPVEAPCPTCRSEERAVWEGR